MRFALVGLGAFWAATAMAQPGPPPYSATSQYSPAGQNLGLGTTASPTGSAQRTLSARAGDLYNVLDYGATGVGSIAAIGTTYGSTLAAIASYTTSSGAKPFSWMTNSAFGLTYTLTTSAAQSSPGTSLTFQTSYTYSNLTPTPVLASWATPLTQQDLMQVGTLVSGPCIAANTTVSAIATTTLQLSANTSAGGTQTQNTETVPTGVITLSQATSSACPSGASITFTISPTQIQGATNDWLGIQSAIAAAYFAPSGGQVFLPKGAYDKNLPIVVPNPNNYEIGNIKINGEGIRNTTIYDFTDLGYGECSIIDGARTGPGGDFEISDMAMLGPSTATGGAGTFVAGMDGLCMGNGSYARRLNIVKYHAGINGQSDHGKVEDTVLNNNFYGFYMSPYSESGGNWYFTKVEGSDNWALFAASWNNGYDSAEFDTIHGINTPYEFYREATPAGYTSAGTFLSSTVFNVIFGEELGNGFIYDEGSLNSVVADVFINVSPAISYGVGYSIPGRGVQAVVYANGNISAVDWIGSNLATGNNPSEVSNGIIQSTETISNMVLNDPTNLFQNNTTIPYLVGAYVTSNTWYGGGNQGIFMTANSAITKGQVVAYGTTLGMNVSSQGVRPMTNGAVPAGIAAQSVNSGAVIAVATSGTVQAIKTTDIGIVNGDAVCVSALTPTSLTDCSNPAAQLGTYSLGAAEDTGASSASQTTVWIGLSSITKLAPSAALPSSIPGLSLWLAADRITGASDASSVSSWTDLSNAGHNASQSTTADQPQYHSTRATFALPNNTPIISFNGTSDALVSAASDSTAQTVCLVALHTTAGGSSGNDPLFSASTTGGLVLYLNSNDTNFGMESDNKAGITGGMAIALDEANPHVYSGSYANPGAWVLSYDKAILTGTSSTTLSGVTTVSLGKRPTVSQYFTGWLGEVIQYNTALSIAQMQQVANYLMVKWGIPH